LVLDRRSIVPEIVTAGLDTVAVRMSSHPVFAEIISELGKPIAAPSANRFGRISPTTAQHVLAELNGRIELIIDAGRTQHGLESTIVRVRGTASRSCGVAQSQQSSYRNLQRSTSSRRRHRKFRLRD